MRSDVRLPADLRPLPPARRLVVRSADGTRLAVEIYGEPSAGPQPGPAPNQPRPTVVLVHGWTCSASFWVRVVHRLVGEVRVVVPDLRGHGGSQEVGPGGFTPGALADDLAAVLAATVPPGERAVVAGHSMGAMALVALAGRHPEALHAHVGAVLLASTGTAELVGRMGARPRRERSFAARARSARSRERLLRFGLGHGRGVQRMPRPLARAAINRVTLAPGATRAVRRYNADVVLACPPETVVGFGDMLAQLDLDADLARLDVPALVLVGTLDRLTPPWHAHRMAAALPRSVGLVEVQGAGHMTPLTAPDAVAEAVHRLLPAGPRPTASR